MKYDIEYRRILIYTKYRLDTYLSLPNLDKYIFMLKLIEQGLLLLNERFKYFNSKSINALDNIIRTSIFEPEVELWKSVKPDFIYELRIKYEYNSAFLIACRRDTNQSVCLSVCEVDSSQSIFDVVFAKCKIDNSKLVVKNRDETISHVIDFDRKAIKIHGIGIFSESEKLEKMLEYVRPNVDSNTRRRIMMDIYPPHCLGCPLPPAPAPPLPQVFRSNRNVSS
jgi:hypothetical protein